MGWGGVEFGELFRRSTPHLHSTSLARHLMAPYTTTLLGCLPPYVTTLPLYTPATAGCRGSAWG